MIRFRHPISGQYVKAIINSITREFEYGGNDVQTLQILIIGDEN
jgi:hypothetical protein